jgi:hypothetical protein
MMKSVPKRSEETRMSTSILFPSRMFEPSKVDDSFAAERAAARNARLPTLLLDQQRLDEGAFARAARGFEADGTGIYRGWMLSVSAYAGLHAALADRGLPLINSPEQYRHCHFLPESYELIRARSPATVWVPLDEGRIDVDDVVEAAKVFGDKPVFIKDYVKSRKHEWAEACFVPSASDGDRLRQVVRTFVERQGPLLAGGVVVRELVELESVGTHPKSGMPLTREHRVFVLDGEALVTARYWAEAEYTDTDLPLGDFADIMKSIESRFFTMDLALGRDGAWHIIELGDAQVAGLLDTIAPSDFFERLAQRLA